jgi:isopenicillin N synthase-like dioxygenase
VQYNIWLPEDVFPGFRQFTTKLFWDLNKTANAILDAFIMSLDLTEKEADSVRALHTGHDNQLRLLHYPPISSEMLKDKDIGRLGAHTDWR